MKHIGNNKLHKQAVVNYRMMIMASFEKIDIKEEITQNKQFLLFATLYSSLFNKFNSHKLRFYIFIQIRF